MQRVSSLMFVPKMAGVCKECGCICHTCSNNSLDLHHEIEELRSKLVCSNNHILQMERDLVQSREYAEQEVVKLQDELAKLRDRYDRLFESYKKVQRINHNLEDKLLINVNNYEMEKLELQKECATLTSKLVDAKVTICELEEENERFRNDCNIAVQLLQCKPSNFVAHRLNTLPLDLQERVKCHLTRDEIIDLENASSQTEETKTIRVPMPTFPPTAMVYSVNKMANAESSTTVQTQTDSQKNETVPTDLIAQVLSHPEPQRKPRRIYICSRCKMDHAVMDEWTQTPRRVHPDTNGVSSPSSMSPPSYLNSPTSGYSACPGVHRPRLNSTETEI